jgi:hypothetical protein
MRYGSGHSPQLSGFATPAARRHASQLLHLCSPHAHAEAGDSALPVYAGAWCSPERLHVVSAGATPLPQCVFVCVMFIACLMSAAALFAWSCSIRIQPSGRLPAHAACSRVYSRPQHCTVDVRDSQSSPLRVSPLILIKRALIAPGGGWLSGDCWALTAPAAGVLHRNALQYCSPSGCWDTM